MYHREILRQFAAFVLAMCSLNGGIAAQTTPSAGKKAAAAHPGWSGVVTYRKTLDDSFSSDEQILGRVQASDRIKHSITHHVVYSGRIVVNDLAGTGRPQTRANAEYSETISRKDIQTESTNCHSWEPSRIVRAESTDRETTLAKGEGEAVSFSASVYNGHFTIGFSLPAIQGQYRRQSSQTYSGLCADSPRKPSASTNERDAPIPSGGASVEGEIDPRDPDVIAGSKTWTDGVTSTSKGFTHTVTWRLRRKPQPLLITDIRFYEPRYPSPSDWHEIGTKGHSVDGNQVKIVATIANLGSSEKTASVNFRELKENTAVGDSAVTATVPANGQKDVELIWDTSGYAWRSSGTDVVPEMERRIQVTIPDDLMEKDITVVPKPLLVIWGFWQAPGSADKFVDMIRAVNEKWGVWNARTDYRKVSTDNADQLDKDVRDIQKMTNAWHIDLVSVTNGGLVGRVYVNSKMPTQFDGRPTATHLVMAGVPNLGTPCAEGLFGLSFKLNTFNLDAVAELSTDAMKRFNLLVNNTNGTRFATLAVHSRQETCKEDINGDGFAPVDSAIWRAKVRYVSERNVTSREILKDVGHFRVIVKWLAIPPKGDHSPDPSTLAEYRPMAVPSLSTDADLGRLLRSRHYGAMYDLTSDDDVIKPDLAKVVVVPAGKTIDVPLTIREGTKCVIRLIAGDGISATLIGEHGEVLGANGADSDDAGEMFRSIMVKGPFRSGKWILQLNDQNVNDAELAVTMFITPAVN